MLMIMESADQVGSEDRLGLLDNKLVGRKDQVHSRGRTVCLERITCIDELNA